MEGLNQWNFNIFVKNIVWNIVSLIPMFYLMFWPKTSANAHSVLNERKSSGPRAGASKWASSGVN